MYLLLVAYLKGSFHPSPNYYKISTRSCNNVTWCEPNPRTCFTAPLIINQIYIIWKNDFNKNYHWSKKLYYLTENCSLKMILFRKLSSRQTDVHHKIQVTNSIILFAESKFKHFFNRIINEFLNLIFCHNQLPISSLDTQTKGKR